MSGGYSLQKYDYGTHEALHTAHICADMVNDHLANHPAIKAVPAWSGLVEKAIDALVDLYQAIGATAPDEAQE